MAELQKTKDFAEFDSGSLVIVTSPLDWSVMLKATGGRLDETGLAVVRAIGNRLADKFELLRVDATIAFEASDKNAIATQAK